MTDFVRCLRPSRAVMRQMIIFEIERVIWPSSLTLMRQMIIFDDRFCSLPPSIPICDATNDHIRNRTRDLAILTLSDAKVIIFEIERVIWPSSLTLMRKDSGRSYFADAKKMHRTVRRFHLRLCDRSYFPDHILKNDLRTECENEDCSLLPDHILSNRVR